MSIQNTRIVVTGVKEENAKFLEFLVARNEANAQIRKLVTQMRLTKKKVARIYAAQNVRDDAKRARLLRQQLARKT